MSSGCSGTPPTATGAGAPLKGGFSAEFQPQEVTLEILLPDHDAALSAGGGTVYHTCSIPDCGFKVCSQCLSCPVSGCDTPNWCQFQAQQRSFREEISPGDHGVRLCLSGLQ